MDFYGYSTHQYNQSDDLAKQLLAQQAFSSSVPYAPGIPGPHVMPTPTDSPWNVQDVSWGLSSPPHVVQFTAQPLSIGNKINPVVHCKRKSLDVEPIIPAKQFITEEKMAAHLNGLHISTDYTSHSLARQEVMDMEAAPISLTEKLKGHTIVLSEEIKKIKDEPLLPAALIERLEKPCMSLVVWKPKESTIEEKSKEEDEEKKFTMEEEKNPVKRNGVLVDNIMGMDVEM